MEFSYIDCKCIFFMYYMYMHCEITFAREKFHL